MGAMGVNLHGDDNEVAFNSFERNSARCTLDGGTDGGSSQGYSAALEVYNANRCYVHHNAAFGHKKHFEMGHDSTNTTDDNVLAYNLFASDTASAVGPNIHGGPPYGPVNRTQIYANTIVFTGANSQALVCGCSGGATVQNNVLVAEWKSAYYDGQLSESHNLYWDLRQTTDTSSDPFVQFTSTSSQTAMSPTSMKADPLFVTPAVPGGDYHLGGTSPGIDLGAPLPTADPRLLEILAQDLDRTPAPKGPRYDVGAYELR